MEAEVTKLYDRIAALETEITVLKANKRMLESDMEVLREANNSLRLKINKAEVDCRCERTSAFVWEKVASRYQTERAEQTRRIQDLINSRNSLNAELIKVTAECREKDRQIKNLEGLLHRDRTNTRREWEQCNHMARERARRAEQERDLALLDLAKVQGALLRANDEIHRMRVEPSRPWEPHLQTKTALLKNKELEIGRLRNELAELKKTQTSWIPSHREYSVMMLKHRFGLTPEEAVKVYDTVMGGSNAESAKDAPKDVPGNSGSCPPCGHRSEASSYQGGN